MSASFVDDFGTGYSSLSYLERLPVHEVKDADTHEVLVEMGCGLVQSWHTARRRGLRVV